MCFGKMVLLIHVICLHAINNLGTHLCAVASHLLLTHQRASTRKTQKKHNVSIRAKTSRYRKVCTGERSSADARVCACMCARKSSVARVCV
jgi:hypothetical protein